jgi:hypothetical protein
VQFHHLFMAFNSDVNFHTRLHIKVFLEVQSPVLIRETTEKYRANGCDSNFDHCNNELLFLQISGPIQGISQIEEIKMCYLLECSHFQSAIPTFFDWEGCQPRRHRHGRRLQSEKRWSINSHRPRISYTWVRRLVIG